MKEGNCVGNIKSSDEARAYFIAFFDQESSARESLIHDIMAGPAKTDPKYRSDLVDHLKANIRKQSMERREDDAGEQGWT